MQFNRKQQPQQESQSNIFGQMIFKYLPYWPLFAALFVVSLAGAWVYLKYKTPLYLSTARVLIKDEKKGAVDSKTVESLDVLSTKKIIENEMEVLQSRTLLHDVVNRLQLYAPLTEEVGFKKVSAYSSSPVKVEAKNPDEMKEIAKVPFKFDAATSKVVIGGSAYKLNEWLKTPYGIIRFIKNENQDPTVTPGDRMYFSIVKPKKIVSNISGMLEVSAANKQASIVDLVLKDEDRNRGEDIVNGIISAYTTGIADDKNVLADNTLNFIETRLHKVEHELDSIERKIQRFRSSRGAVDIGMQGKLFLENVSNNDQKLGEINMQLAALGQVENYVVSKNAAGGIAPSTLGVSDPTLSRLVEKLSASELQYESMKKTTGENNPLLVSVQDQIEKIKPSIVENIRNQRSSLLASRNNLSATNSNYSSALQGIPEKERQLVEINREQSIKNDIYNFLLQKREEAALSHASTSSDSKVIDAAESSEMPVSPKPKVIYMSALLIALFAGMGVVFSKETFSRKIMFRHEIETFTTQPIIGEITSETSHNPIVIGTGKKTFIAEQFRKLRATLPYLGVNATHKKILVTSSISGEGKSFVASNLALTLALTGKKVVLLDFDLNNPSLNNKLNIKKQIGITNFLSGEVEVDDIILQTDLHKNLYLVPTGDLPNNPSELIITGRTQELFTQLEAKFDYLVIDTAPVVPVTDAYMLSPYCDATLFVVRHAYTPKLFVHRIDENNKINELNNIGIVFNAVSARGFGNKSYGYGYGYGYITGEKEVRKLLPLSFGH